MRTLERDFLAETVAALMFVLVFEKSKMGGVGGVEEDVGLMADNGEEQGRRRFIRVDVQLSLSVYSRRNLTMRREFLTIFACFLKNKF